MRMYFRGRKYHPLASLGARQYPKLGRFRVVESVLANRHTNDKGPNDGGESSGLGEDGVQAAAERRTHCGSIALEGGDRTSIHHLRSMRALSVTKPKAC